ncbi:MAG: hypothetical protein AAF721_11315 [Myxococcota bacterium]
MASRVTARRRRAPKNGGRACESPSDLLVHRCRTLIRRGKHRQAVGALRQLAHRDQRPAVWVRLGVLLARAERTEASVDALKQGWWLHRREGQHRRAAVVAELIERVEAGCFPLAA